MKSCDPRRKYIFINETCAFRARLIDASTVHLEEEEEHAKRSGRRAGREQQEEDGSKGKA